MQAARVFNHPLPRGSIGSDMSKVSIFLSLCWLALLSPADGAREILLQISPEPESPVIAKITATDRVILDAAPAGQNAEQGWRQLALPTPFEGYVPLATLDKNMAIVPGTPVHYLPTAQSPEITQVERDERYEVVREKDDWATVRFYKPVNGYFLLDDDAPAVSVDMNSERLRAPVRVEAATPGPIAETEPTAARTNRRTDSTVEPLTIPAPRWPVNPDAPISQIDPRSLPPENVTWKPASSARSERGGHHASRSSDPASRLPDHASSIMVTPDQTQAREPARDLGPAKTPRLLTGQLVRQIEADGPGYPIRLRSPEGRLIAYVDLSGIYLPDLDPYINETVYIRGQIHPLPETSAQLVILAESLRIAGD